MKNLPTKLLFFDTCSILKFFIDESGSNVIKWLCNSNAKLQYALHFSTSIQVKEEFIEVINNKYNRNIISSEQKNKILYIAESYFKDFFHLRDNKPIPGFKIGEDVDENVILKKYKLNPNKNSGDAKIIACVINFMRPAVDSSRPHIITSDKKFKYIIMNEGNKVIDPEETDIFELGKYLISL